MMGFVNPPPAPSKIGPDSVSESAPSGGLCPCGIGGRSFGGSSPWPAAAIASTTVAVGTGGPSLREHKHSHTRHRRRRYSTRRTTAVPPATALVVLVACALTASAFFGSPQHNPLFFPVAMAQSSGTSAPSDVPSHVPSRTPTPVEESSGEPTPRPTPRPSPRRSRIPTPLPTPAPSDRPSLIPTRRRRNPTSTPTFAPTPDPTAEPTTETPTASPTETRAPTTFTRSPTVSPAPTKRPTHDPTPEPTKPPVTSNPTVAPTYLKVTDAVSVVMTFESVTAIFENRTALTFESETGVFIRSSIITQDLGTAPLTYLKVDVNVAQQKTLNGAASASASGGRRHRHRRHLQQSSSSSSLVPLQATLDVTVEYRSSKTDYSAKLWVGDAFNSPEKRAAYLDRLKGTGDAAFANLQSVDVLVDGTAPIEQPDTPPAATPNNTGTLIAIIVGSVVGGIIVVALILYGVRKSHDPNKNGFGARPPTATTGSHQTPGSGSDQKLATEILVEGYQDDVSTLGDPVGWTYGAGGATVLMEDRTASVGPMGAVDDNYRYAAVAAAGVGGGGGTTIASKTQPPPTRNSSAGTGLSEDDASFDRQFGLDGGEVEVGDDDDLVGGGGAGGREDRFEVEAPPGKLGMVIDTPGGGVPVVHALKADSALSGAVQVGDRLLYVDSEDVTGLTALQVSKLISLKSDQPRALVFARTRGAEDPPASDQ